MKRILKSISNSIVVVVMAISTMCTSNFLMTQTAGATASSAGTFGVETAVLKTCTGDVDGIFCILNIALQILTYGVGIVGTLGIVISGIMYLTARDNEQQMTKAKSRIINIIIGLVIYAMMWGLLQWLLPGGIGS